MRVFGLAGWSGSGKTTLMVNLIPEIIARGITVSTVKHAHHEFDIDRPGKDSFEHRRAGATEVMISSANRWAVNLDLGMGLPFKSFHEQQIHGRHLVHEHFQRRIFHPPKFMHKRPAVNKPLLQPDDPHIIAVASDGDLPKVTVPVLPLGDAAVITNFILDAVALKAA